MFVFKVIVYIIFTLMCLIETIKFIDRRLKAKRLKDNNNKEGYYVDSGTSNPIDIYIEKSNYNITYFKSEFDKSIHATWKEGNNTITKKIPEYKMLNNEYILIEYDPEIRKEFKAMRNYVRYRRLIWNIRKILSIK